MLSEAGGLLTGESTTYTGYKSLHQWTAFVAFRPDCLAIIGHSLVAHFTQTHILHASHQGGSGGPPPPVSVVINGFYPKTEAWESAEHLLCTQLAALAQVIKIFLLPHFLFFEYMPNPLGHSPPASQAGRRVGPALYSLRTHCAQHWPKGVQSCDESWAVSHWLSIGRKSNLVGLSFWSSGL